MYNKILCITIIILPVYNIVEYHLINLNLGTQLYV